MDDKGLSFPPGFRKNSKAVNEKIRAVAGRQHRFITTKQLLACGLTSSAINRRVASGWLFRVAPGVYAVGMPCDDEQDFRYANVLACSPGSVLGGLASIERRDFTRFRADTVLIETPKLCRVSLAPKFNVVQSRVQRDGHARTLDGVPIASLPWAIAHLGNELDSPQICHVIHQSLWRRKIRLDEVELLLERYPRIAGHRNVVDAVLDNRAGSAGTRSFLEDRFRAIFIRVLGFAPTFNVHVDAGRESIEIDVPFLDLKIALEVDGPPHDEPSQQAKDRARDAALVADGWVVHRFHWRQIDHRPWEVEQRLRAIFA